MNKLLKQILKPFQVHATIGNERVKYECFDVKFIVDKDKSFKTVFVDD